MALLAIVILAVVLVIPVSAIVGAAVLVRRPFGGLAAAVAALALVCGYLMSPFPHAAAGTLYVALPPLRLPLIEADLALSRGARERIVRLATTRSLQPGEYEGEFRLPAGDAGLSVRGTVEVIEHDCGDRVFFMTLTGYSPDPYSGFEYVPSGCEPELDPLGSGNGTPQPLSGGWFWIEAR